MCSLVSRRNRLICAVLLFLGACTPGCGTIRQAPVTSVARNPAPKSYRFKISRSDWTELHKGDGFTFLMGQWFDPEHFQRQRDEVIETLRGINYPVERDRALIEQTAREVRAMEMYMQEETEQERAAFLVLGVFMDDDVMLKFSGPGALVVSLEGDTATAQQPDRGILLCPDREHGSYLDTARKPATFHRGFDGRPDYSERPNLMYVRLAPEAYGRSVVGVRILAERVLVFRKQ